MTSKKSAGVVAARTQQAAPAPGRGRSAAVAAGQEPDSAAAAAAGTDLVDGDGYGYGDGDGDGDGVDFVTFVVEGETYAFPMERVEEIIRMPQAVRMPLAPPSLEGLANLRGRVLPIVSLRSCCGLPPVEHDEATRVIVVDGGATLGFVVDRVASVTSVRAARIEPAERIGGSIDSELLSGVIRPDSKDDQLTKVLDVASLVAGQFALLGESSGRGGPGAGAVAVEGRAGVQQDRAEEADDDTLELVSFAVDGQEYALPIDLVQEIVQAPEQVTTVPNAEDRVLGVMDLRGRLLPVVSLRKVFGLASAPLEPQNRIVVVQLPGGGTGGGGVVGVVMDTVREVLRVPHRLVAELPDFMAGAGRAHEVEAICRLEQGKRLVSVLSVERMFARDELRSALREAAGDEAGPGEREDDVVAGEVVAAEQDSEIEDELLVVFRLADEEYSVGVDVVQEIIRVPETLIRVPKALDFVEGLVNLRGAVLPVVDLRTRLGLVRSERDERQRIIVLLVNGVRTGFIVDSVTEVLRVTRGDLEPAPELSPEQSRLVSRVANLPDSRRMLMMLEPDHLIAGDRLGTLIPQPREAEAEDKVKVKVEDKVKAEAEVLAG